MVFYSPDWTNTEFSFILLTVNLFPHSALTEQGLYFFFLRILFLNLWFGHNKKLKNDIRIYLFLHSTCFSKISGALIAFLYTEGL